MKKILLFTAAVALVALSLVSCKKNNGGTTDEPVKEEAQLEAPAQAEEAVTITFAQPETVTAADLITIDKYRVLPKKVIFTESGRYVFIGTIYEIVKANIGDTYTKTGEYTKDAQGNYQMPGIGSVKPGETPKEQGGTTETSAQLTSEKGETINPAATVTDCAPASGETESNMLRGWVPDGKVKVSIPSKGINTSLDPDLEAIAQYLYDHNININPDDYTGYAIAEFTLSKADQSFIVAFKNGEAYVGSWKWTNESAGKFQYNFSSNLGGELISGSAEGSVVFYSQNNVNKCDFSMSISAKDVTGFMDLTLKEKK